MPTDYTFTPTLRPRLIYVYSIDDEAHRGYLKVGQTSLSEDMPPEGYQPNAKQLNEVAHKRIKEQTQTAAVPYDLRHTELTHYVSEDGEACYFSDHKVHDVLRRSGVKRMKQGREWFQCNLETVRAAIQAVKEGRDAIDPQHRIALEELIEFRPEQEEAISKTVNVFRKKSGSKRFLWDAKMRFGKTLCALEVVRQMHYRRTLILTHRPVVKDGWFEDFRKIFDDKSGYRFGAKDRGHNLSALEAGTASYVYFASIQDLRGSETVGGEYDKNQQLFSIDWDLIIVDEAHEGTQTDLGQKVLEQLLEDKDTRTLSLSGTPFNLLRGYKDSEVYRWDYLMEQHAKRHWKELHPDDPNPYAGLPELNIYTYDLGSLLATAEIEGGAFNFREFFRVDEWSGEFVHSDDVDRFLDLLCGINTGAEGNLYPFATEDFRATFRHTLWVLPGVAAARLLKKRLESHQIFQHFTIVNVAGAGDEEIDSSNALEAVRSAIQEHQDDGYTITLTCGRLTTGVTVPEWTAVLMLYGSWQTSPASYMQTIFRVQSPYSHKGRVKESCYAFDFAPDRALRVIMDTIGASARVGKQTEDERQRVGEFLNYCPVIAMTGSTMTPYSVDEMIVQLNRIRIENIVRSGFEDTHLYNSIELSRLDDNGLKLLSNLQGIIGKTQISKSKSQVDINQQGLTDEEYDELEKTKKKAKKDRTPEEQARLDELNAKNKARANAISILRGISIRMPLILFGAEIEDENKELTIDNFTSLVDDESWGEFMPKGVTKEHFDQIKKFYDPTAFKAAGHRIRELARIADSYTVEERIVSLAELFGTFRNPDKETVLTPWRAVNMHLAEALGGYTFYDETYEESLDVPRYVSIPGVTDDAFDLSTHILEINSKSGLYPLYATYSIYRRRLEKAREQFGHGAQAMERQLWDLTLQENIYILCKTPMARSITRRTLAGFRTDVTIHTVYYEGLVEQLRAENTFPYVINTLQTPKFWSLSNTTNKMKFDTIIGNPPYQISTDNSRTKPIYDLFIDLSMQLAQRASLITPARYLFNVGFTSKKWNEKILADKHLKVVLYRPKSTDVFPNVDIKGGVASIYYDKNRNFGGIGDFKAYEELDSISEKVNSVSEPSLVDIIYAESSYRFDTNKEFVQQLVSERLGNDKKVISNVFEKLPDLFTEVQGKGQIGFYGRLGSDRCIRYIERRYIEDHPNLEKYKVFVPESNGSGAIGEVLSTPLIGEPLIGGTQTFLSIGAFDSRSEAEACLKYIKTKFARTMLGILKATQHNPKDTWRLVPLQDFTAGSDIDWSQSVAEIDRQLYKKYALTPDEIAFIEEKVSPMV